MANKMIRDRTRLMVVVPHAGRDGKKMSVSASDAPNLTASDFCVVGVAGS